MRSASFYVYGVDPDHLETVNEELELNIMARFTHVGDNMFNSTVHSDRSHPAIDNQANGQKGVSLGWTKYGGIVAA